MKLDVFQRSTFETRQRKRRKRTTSERDRRFLPDNKSKSSSSENEQGQVGKKVKNVFCNHPTTSAGSCNICTQNKKIQIGGGTPVRSVDDDDDPFNINFNPQISSLFSLHLRNSKKFGANVAHEVIYDVIVTEPSPYLHLDNALAQLKAMFETLLQHLRTRFGNKDFVRIFIQHPVLESTIIILPLPLRDMSADIILERVEFVLQSSQSVPVDEELLISVAVIRMFQGSGHLKMTNVEEERIRKRSLITIKNVDNLCLARAVVVAKAWMDSTNNVHDKEKQKYFKSIKDHRIKLQQREAQNLLNKVGLSSNKAGEIGDIRKFEKHLNISISVISSFAGNQRLYRGCNFYNVPISRRVNLYHHYTDYPRCHKGHYDVITSVNAIMNCKEYCDECHKAFNVKTQHKCNSWCNSCGTANCKEIHGQEKICNACNYTCRSIECYNRHTKGKLISKGQRKGQRAESICSKVWKCLQCGVVLNKKFRNHAFHQCGEIKCKNCYQYSTDENHFCYMRAISSEKKKTAGKFLFYDYECTQEENVHIPILIVVHSVCEKCMDKNVKRCYYCGSRCNKCGIKRSKKGYFANAPCRFTCGKREKIFYGKGCNKKFCQWMIHKSHKDFTIIAHNARSYDLHFIYSYCVANAIVPKPLIMNGTKIMYMKLKMGLNIRFLDSINFFPMSLSKLPKCFELDEMCKGYFPHFFNTKKNQKVVQNCLPHINYYAVNSMNTEAREKFLSWYDCNKNNNFNLKKDMLEYCRSDVDILKKACIKYRNLIMTISADKKGNYIDPFSFITVASLCMGFYRNKFLSEEWSVLSRNNAVEMCSHEWECVCIWFKARKLNGDSELEVFNEDISEWEVFTPLKYCKTKFIKSVVGLFPPVSGYGRRDNYSIEAMQWLTVLQKKMENKLGEQINIQHALSANGEKIVIYKNDNSLKYIKYKLDGYFIDSLGKRYACDFYGCHWHGCLKCYSTNRLRTRVASLSIEQRYRNTKIREKRLKEMGFIVITKWSCEFKLDIMSGKVSGSCFGEEDSEKFKPIILRDCYFGGRTNAVKLYHKFEGNEKGKYIDFCSLYPAVLKYCEYPVGHPVRIVSDFLPLQYKMKCNCKDISGDISLIKCLFHGENMNEHVKIPYFGLIKVKVLPPRRLFLPVLPYRSNGKLKFPLCRKCSDIENLTQSCICSEEERAIIYTYTTPELELALNVGYKIITIYEILHFDSTEKYNKSLKEGGLYCDYVNTFLRLKQEASGFPTNVVSEKDICDYLDRYEKYEGVQLKRENIRKNEGLRQSSKLQLNSFYGKFGQHTNKKKLLLVTTPNLLYKTILDPSKTLTDFYVMNDKMMQLEYEDDKLFQDISPSTNVILAAFCTAWARMKLWSVLIRLGRRNLYHDTDSIIYISKPGMYDPPCGEFLGELNNELSCAKLNCSRRDTHEHFVKEFVSCGPKNYAYKLNTGETVCKVRGFSLNYCNSQILNFESMKDVLLTWYAEKMGSNVTEANTESDQRLITITTRILRDKRKPKVYNRVVSKHYGVVYNKRYLSDEYYTLPFGY